MDSLLLFARFDKSGDGTVTLLEFKEELKPKTWKKYLYMIGILLKYRFSYAAD